MPRVRIICQACGRQLSYLELAPFWRARAICPDCKVVTIASVGPAGEVQLQREEVAAKARTAAQAGRGETRDTRRAG